VYVDLTYYSGISGEFNAIRICTLLVEIMHSNE